MQAVAFDLDGTLVDTTRAHGEAYMRAFAEFGVEIDATAFEAHVGKHQSDIIRALAGASYRRLDVEQLHVRKTEHYSELAPQLARPLALLELARGLRGRTPMALVTSATRRTATASLTRWFDVDDFDVVVTADDVTRHKPDPEPFLLASRLLGVGPEGVLVFEDSPSGITAAVRAGCLVCPVAALPADPPSESVA